MSEPKIILCMSRHYEPAVESVPVNCCACGTELWLSLGSSALTGAAPICRTCLTVFAESDDLEIQLPPGQRQEMESLGYDMPLMDRLHRDLNAKLRRLRKR